MEGKWKLHGSMASGGAIGIRPRRWQCRFRPIHLLLLSLSSLKLFNTLEVLEIIHRHPDSLYGKTQTIQIQITQRMVRESRQMTYPMDILNYRSTVVTTTRSLGAATLLNVRSAWPTAGEVGVYSFKWICVSV